MDRRAALTGAAVVIAAFAGAWFFVRTAQRLTRLDVGAESDGGELVTFADPPLRPLGARAESFAAARCRELAPAAPIDALGGAALDWGDGVIDASGLAAAGVVRAKANVRAASVVAIAARAARAGKTAFEAPVVIDLGVAGGDDPAPRPFVVAGWLYAARIETTRDVRRLVVDEVGSIDAAGALAAHPREATSFAQSLDESLAFDVAASGDHAIAVWDDDERGRGVIRAGLVSRAPNAAPSANANADGGASRPWVVSPTTSDAEAPRVLADGAGGAWIAWIARKPELDAGAAESAARALESPAEAREERWVEVTRVGTSGASNVAAVRLAPARVSDFDLLLDDRGLVVLLRDEAGTLEARGARLVRQRVAAQGDALTASAPEVLVADGVGAADPIALDDGAGGLVLYGDLAERPRVVPLGAANASANPPSLEPLLDGARVLASRAGGLPGVGGATAHGAALFAAGSRGERPEARIMLCER